MESVGTWYNTAIVFFLNFIVVYIASFASHVLSAYTSEKIKALLNAIT
jgi:hypothetical protein